MEATTNPFSSPKFDAPGREEIDYRTLSRAAVMALAAGVVSLLGFLVWTLVALSLVSLVLGWVAVRQIRKYPLEYSGAGLAYAAVAVAVLSFVGGTSWHTYVYLTEVPEGFERISWYELQPGDDSPHLPFSPRAAELDGQKIFVKGYVYPEDQFGETQRFVLVPDLGTCCFGGQPKLTDMIEVTLEDPHRVTYSRRQRKLAGVLEVDQRLKPIDGLQGVYFRLKASYVK